MEGVEAAAKEGEAGELGDEGRVFVVDLVAATGGGPIGCIPDGGIEGHGL